MALHVCFNKKSIDVSMGLVVWYMHIKTTVAIMSIIIFFQDVFKYNVIMCIGAGIGVTPFASILKSVW